MTETDSASAAPVGDRRIAYRLAVPAAALLLVGTLALLWRSGIDWLYFDILGMFAVDPFRFPFLDIHAVLAAAECGRQGVDIYLQDPCDALGRPHVYSPLWLALIPDFLDTGATTWVGASLALLFIMSLPAVLRPETRGETLVLALTALSPMTVFALERANNDLAIFLLVLWGSILGRARYPWRLGSYAIYLTAGLLKYYPLALLALLVRERPRDGLAIAAAAAAAVLLFAACDHVALGKALANIPAASYFTNSFSAFNLPFGLVETMAGLRHREALGFALLSLVAAVAIARTRRTFLILDAGAPDWAGAEAHCLVVGAMLLTACFFAGQNANYRGVYFVLMMPGLVCLRRSAGNAHIGRFLMRMIAAVLFVVWEEVFRQGLQAMSALIPNRALAVRVEAMFWIGRELVWWWLIAGLAAIVVWRLSQTPLGRSTLASLARRRREARAAGRCG